MNVKRLAIAFVASMAVFVSSCTEVAITGRKQLNLVPDSLINSMSFQEYEQFLSENKVVAGTADVEMVKRVGRRIEGAVESYFAEQGMSDALAGYEWEFNLVEDPAVNAWCMPGGKVVVYSGLLPVTQNEAGLAVVMGHEIAHAVAEHGNERMSQGLLVEMGGMALSAAMRNSPEKTKELFVQSYGIGTQVGILLPYSRTQESEADRLGLIFMAMAGYEPEEAFTFWERMAASKEGEGSPPELLSTHPADSTRIENIRQLLPEAKRYYRKASQ